MCGYNLGFCVRIRGDFCNEVKYFKFLVLKNVFCF